jgi:uncharacterized membrane protein YphA (DoxX/SURF4 family)
LTYSFVSEKTKQWNQGCFFDEKFFFYFLFCDIILGFRKKKRNMKKNKIIYWVLTVLVGAIFGLSAFGKLTSNPEAVKMASEFGIDAHTYFLIGGVEVLSLLLFILPRTGIIGTVLLSAYMGGAIATHVQHGVPVLAPCIILTFILLVAVYRFPELTQRLFGKIH